MTCHQCRRPVEIERNYCGACGALLVRYCAACGFRNLAADRYCGGCGLDLAANEADADGRPHTPPPPPIVEQTPPPSSTPPESRADADLDELLQVARDAEQEEVEEEHVKVDQSDIDALFGD